MSSFLRTPGDQLLLWPLPEVKRRDPTLGDDTREALTFPLITSRGFGLIVKQNSQMSYHFVAQLFPQLLVLERGQEQPNPPFHKPC